MKILLDKLGNPERKLKNIIHVAGTNGKGSTIAFIRSILQKAGFSVNTYTSPHIHNFNERINIQGSDIGENDLYAIMEECRHQFEGCDFTFYECTTAAAIFAFSERKSDFNLIETGCGGRFDATNILSNKLLSVITKIAFDHQNILGSNIKDIASHKAGIIESKTPFIVAKQQYSEVLDIINSEAELKESTGIFFGNDYAYQVNDDDTSLSFIYNNQEHNFQRPSLIGNHQLDNAATAIAVGLFLQQSGYNLTPSDINNGITSAKWRSRLEKLDNQNILSLFKNPVSIWLDGAHNPDGAYAISEHIKLHYKHHETAIIIGLTKGKDIEEFVEPLFEAAKTIIAVKVYGEPDSYDALQIASFSKFPNQIIACESVSDALELIANKYSEINNIFITGSLYLARDV